MSRKAPEAFVFVEARTVVRGALTVCTETDGEQPEPHAGQTGDAVGRRAVTEHRAE